MQKLAAPKTSTGSNYGSGCSFATDASAAPEEFPAGLRVLVVDDDVTCLKILEQMLRKCRYHVTTCCQAMTALSLLRERKGCFDLVISDVHMPDMDGFKLLELVGLEMDLPVIMMSGDGRTSAVMRGIKHGACDYLIKPVRMEELKNVWQHVVRKKRNENKDVENSGSFEDSDRQRRVADESEFTSSANEGTDASWKAWKMKRDSKDEDDGAEPDNEDPSVSKKPRVVWSVELHQQFVNAVNQVGIDKAVPKRILELMNVPGLTRENVASHLQKFRLYLKRISGVTQHQAALPNLFCNQVEASTKCGPLGSLDFRSLAASGQISPQTLAALHAELLGHPSGNSVFPIMDQPVLPQASCQGSKFVPLEKEVAFGQPLSKCQPGMQKQFPPSGITVQDMFSGFSSWSSNQLGVTGSANHHQETFHSVVSDSSSAIHVQPSSVVVPSKSPSFINGGFNSGPINQEPLVLPPQSSSNAQFGSNSVLATSNSAFNRSTTAFDYSNLSSRLSNPPSGMVHASNGDLKNVGMKSCFINRTPDHLPNLFIQGSELNSGASFNQGQFRNLGFVGKGACLPSRFAVDDLESPTSDLGFTKTNTFDDVENVKHKHNLDFHGGSKVGNTMLTNFPSSDFLGVLPNDSQAGCFLKS